MIERIPVILVIWILISSILLTIVIIPDTATCESTQDDSEQPKVEIRLLDESQTAHVGPDDNRVVVFNGTVKVTCETGVGVLVRLYAQDTWGSADIAPDSFLFSESGERVFDVECFPRKRESTLHIGTVQIQGRWWIPDKDLSGPAEPVYGVTGTIHVAQFHRYTLKSPKAFSIVDPGSYELMALTIQNRGNGKDLFAIKVKNLDELLKKDYKVTLNQTLIEIPESPEEFTIQILIEVPADEYWMSYEEISIEVTSVQGVEVGVEPQIFEFVIRIESEAYRLVKNYPTCLLAILIIIIIGFIWLLRFRRRMIKEIKKEK